MLTLKGKVILITGASSGIGRMCAIIASMLDASIILIGRDAEKLNQTLGNLKPGNHLTYSYDLNDVSGIEEIIAECTLKVGKINGFIHSAGIELTKPLLTLHAKDFQDLFNINVIAAFELAKQISKKKYCSPEGASYIFISSVTGKIGEPGKIAYSSSKAALIGGSKSMAKELANRNIRVNCILPGIVQTELTDKMFKSIPEDSVRKIIEKHPLGIGTPEDIAYCASFLLSDLARWITGASIVIDGGYSI